MLYKILSKCTLVPMKCFCIYALWFLRNIVKMYFGLYQMLWKYILVSHKSWISIDVLLRLVDQSPNCISGTKISCPPRTSSRVLCSGVLKYILCRFKCCTPRITNLLKPNAFHYIIGGYIHTSEIKLINPPKNIRQSPINPPQNPNMMGRVIKTTPL